MNSRMWCCTQRSRTLTMYRHNSIGAMPLAPCFGHVLHPALTHDVSAQFHWLLVSAMCCTPRSRTRARCSWVRGWNKTCRRRRCRAGTAGGGRTTGLGLPGMPGGHVSCPCASRAPCSEVAAGLGDARPTTHHPPTVPAITIEARPRRRWTSIRWHHKIPVGEFRPLNDVAAHCAHPSWLPWSRHLRGQGKEGGGRCT